MDSNDHVAQTESTWLRPGRTWLDPGRRSGAGFSSLLRDQTGTWAHLASCKMTTDAWVKTTEYRASHSTVS